MPQNLLEKLIETVTDPALLKGFNAFKKRSLVTPVVDSRQDSGESLSTVIKTKKKKRQRSDLPAQLMQQSKKQAQQQTFNYKTHGQIRTKSRFSVLSSIVDLLKSRYQQKKFESVSLDELLDLTKKERQGMA